MKVSGHVFAVRVKYFVVFYREINKQFSQVVDTLFVSPIINSNNKYPLLFFIYKSYHDPANT
jgi:hypothetical protein